MYNGHKRCNALKLDVIVTLGGVFVGRHRPVECTWHDTYMYQLSGLEQFIKWEP